MNVTLLLDDHFAPVANKMLLTTMGQDALQWPLIHFDWHRPLPVELTWGVWALATGRKPADMSTGIRYSEESHAIQAVIAGQGVALLSLLLIEEELRLGVLQIVSKPVLKGMSYYLVKSQKYASPEAVTIVEEWLLRVAHQSG
ncbi:MULTISPECIES: LysR substrate-binding domain-containing protein [unclassified Serratia (in: enterobacteria)]|uniref:LysR substrate-binding domain-containing protein n=1 Tax=unclassified Serratia (in: enterobacteria) TaxID=2647522 RepID=UPI0018CD557B|nr:MULTISPECIES: LysR substrate-binding domain-containing protein [unclassified Serratia (in: enterobacteria)]